MSYLAVIAVIIGALAILVRRIEPRLAFFPYVGETETPQLFGLAFDAVTIETTDGEKLRAWRIEAPAPRAPRARIVYFHGNGGNLSNWASILAEIVRHGYSVFAIDYRGYGLSTGRPTEQGLYRDVEAALPVAWPGGDPGTPIVYWGRSLGGAMASFAATVRKPDGVIIEAGFPNARAAIRNSPVLAALSLFASYRFPAAEFLARADTPVLIMHGDRDSVIPFALGRELFEQIGGRKEFVVIAGGDHNDATAPDPAAYWAAIDRFVNSLPRRTP
jgi:fermentation-respiration switch protein FrsA (DUF1100 family)